MNDYTTTDPARPSTARRWLVVAAAVGLPAIAGVALIANHDTASIAAGGRPTLDTTATTATTIAPTTTTLAPASFVGIEPVRVLDTRTISPIGVTTPGALKAGAQIDVAVAGAKGIPANATSVAVNITIDGDATLKSFLTVWPAGQPRPLASSNNAEPGLVLANSAVLKVGAGGKLSVFNQQGAVNVVMDVTGYFVDASATGATTTTSTTAAPTSTTT